jgi:RNA polymerase sigma-70 factor, ECF subfamily
VKPPPTTDEHAWDPPRTGGVAIEIQAYRGAVSEPHHASTLLGRVAAGDSAAVGDFYDRYRPMIMRTVLGLMGGDRALAEDVLQETALRLWRAGARFDPALGSEEVYVRVVARRAAVDLLRRRRELPASWVADAADAADAAEAVRGDRVTPAAHARVLDADVVRRALATLSDAHREVVTRAYLRDESYTDIAVGLGVPAATVRTRVFYALRAMRRAMTEEDS